MPLQSFGVESAQLPEAQASPVVQNSPSSHGVPSSSAVRMSQLPGAPNVSHMEALHWSPNAEQSTRVPPWHRPSTQLRSRMHGLSTMQSSELRHSLQEFVSSLQTSVCGQGFPVEMQPECALQTTCPLQKRPSSSQSELLA